MDPSGAQGFVSALTEIAAHLADAKSKDVGVGVVSFAVVHDAALMRLSMDYARRLDRQVETRLRACLRKQDMLFVLPGGEWLITLPCLASTAILTLAMLKLSQAFNGVPIELDGMDVQVQVVCGAALSPLHGEDAFHLLQSARIACAEARRGEGGSVVFDSGMEKAAPDAARLERDLRAAFSGGRELELYLQPKVHVRSGECRSAEALLRWQGGNGAWVPPPLVISLIDRLGLRHRFNRWLFQRAAHMMHMLRLEGLDIGLSINLSATDLYDAEVPDLIEQALATWSAPAHLLCLEITETSMLDESAGEGVTEVLRRLSELGVTLSIDDFGTGFSGMSRLKRLLVQEVKIDRCFVSDLAGSPRDREICASIIDLSHRLELEVTAEGAESADTVAVLEQMGCDHIQGYFYSRALPLRDFVDWVRARAGIATDPAMPRLN